MRKVQQEELQGEHPRRRDLSVQRPGGVSEFTMAVQQQTAWRARGSGQLGTEADTEEEGETCLIYIFKGHFAAWGSTDPGRQGDQWFKLANLAAWSKLGQGRDGHKTWLG